MQEIDGNNKCDPNYNPNLVAELSNRDIGSVKAVRICSVDTWRKLTVNVSLLIVLYKIFQRQQADLEFTDAHNGIREEDNDNGAWRGGLYVDLFNLGQQFDYVFDQYSIQ